MDTKLAKSIETTGGELIWWPATMASSRWVRVRRGDVTIAESLKPQLYLEYGPPPHLPTYFFPPDEVRDDVLIDPRKRNDGSTVWTVEVDGERLPDAAWTHPDPVGVLEPLDGMITFTWFGDLDWYEESERALVHARDPYKRVDVLTSSRHVEVWVDGTRLADTVRPSLLFETLLPTRFYIPPEDVRLELLVASETTTACPYKGVSRHFSLVDGTADIAWSYPDPIVENPKVRDLICFYNEKVDLIVDGEPQARPITPWSP